MKPKNRAENDGDLLQIIESLLISDLKAEEFEEGSACKCGELIWQRKARAKLSQWN